LHPNPFRLARGALPVLLAGMAGVAGAQTALLDTGTPSGTAAPALLYPAQSLGGEFAATAGQRITEVGAYLTAGTAVAGDSFEFEILSGSITTRNGFSVAATFADTFTANGWVVDNVNWTAPASADYWLALVQPTTGYQFDAPQESSATTGAAPALAFAFKGTGSTYSTTGAPWIGLEVVAAAVPEPQSWASLALGLAALALTRARWRRTRR
jgi:hypothetical protein